MRARSTAIATIAIVTWLSVVAPALAKEGGEGLYGKTDDKVITNFGFGLLVLFTTIVVSFSLIQGWLNRRKERK